MIDPVILQQVHKIELQVRRLMQSLGAGDVRSKVKGIGFELNQIREYQHGDDVRFIDWKGSARSGKMLIKECFEEQSRTIVIIIDGSATEFYGSQEHLKFSVMAQAASALALAGVLHKDKVSLVVATDQKNIIIPAKTGRKSVYAMIEKLFETEKSKQRPIVKQVFKSLVEKFKKGALVFILSDFIDQAWEQEIKKVSQLFDMVAIRCLDKNETSSFLFGPLSVTDMNSNISLEITPSQLHKFQENFVQRLDTQKKLLANYQVACLDIQSNYDFIDDMIAFLRKRLKRR
ncbi:hypothetical protein A3F06_03245 [candidate division TM6 bacterium RIFCSPHIGHO2_12_FULL_36_22]|nr:MAG: hypothetical protein A3F06_03245 [candidate division TM6 bacterium RIFCSPHIGHO2_12_FULL_36_22]